MISTELIILIIIAIVVAGYLFMYPDLKKRKDLNLTNTITGNDDEDNISKFLSNCEIIKPTNHWLKAWDRTSFQNNIIKNVQLLSQWIGNDIVSDMDRIYQNRDADENFKVLVYYAGVLAFDISKDREPNSMKNCIYLFECAIELDNKYHQAYNRLGDSYFIKGDYQKAINHYNTSIHYIKTDLIAGLSGRKIPMDLYRGDNYIRIGLSLIKTGNEKLAKIFIKTGKELIDDNQYDWFKRIGYESWDDIGN